MAPQKKNSLPGMEAENKDRQQYCAADMKKEMILKRLKMKGGRITRQRELLIDIILKNEFSSCKEIYYDAVKVLPEIGMATIYRTVSALEEIGALRKQNICCVGRREPAEVKECVIRLEDDTLVTLNESLLNQVIESGMAESGLLQGKRVKTVLVRPCGEEMPEQSWHMAAAAAQAMK